MLFTVACERGGRFEAAVADAGDSMEPEEYARALSPDGSVMASVYHYPSANGGLTQVNLGAVKQGCGSGSAAWQAYDIGVELRWVAAGLLEVTYPPGLPFSHNASGDYLYCGAAETRVVMVPGDRATVPGQRYGLPETSVLAVSPDGRKVVGVTRYTSPAGGVALAFVDYPSIRGCNQSIATFYAHDVLLAADWVSDDHLKLNYRDGVAFDLPPWGDRHRCLGDTTRVTVKPAV